MSESEYPFDRNFLPDDILSAAWDTSDALAPLLSEVESRSDTPAEALRALVRAMGKTGLLGLVGPAAHGGAFEHISSRALCVARERLGEVSPLVDLAFAMQGLGSCPITLGGSEAQRSQWLPSVMRGEAVAAFALTEPEAGSDVAAMQTRAVREGDDYVVTGEKCFISNAGIADVYTLFAVTAPDAQRGRVSAFILPADTPGLDPYVQPILGGHPLGGLRLQGCRLPATHLIGAEGDGMRLALGTLQRFRPTVGGAAVGMALRALKEAVAHVKERHQFGAPLSELPAVQARLADMACRIDAARLLVHRAAASADRGDPRGEMTRTGSMAKLVATEYAQLVIDDAVQLHGGRGVLKSSVVARLYEDIRSLRIYEGTNDVHKTLIARELLR